MRLLVAIAISVVTAFPGAVLAGARYRCHRSGRVMHHACCPDRGHRDRPATSPHDQARAASCCERIPAGIRASQAPGEEAVPASDASRGHAALAAPLAPSRLALTLSPPPGLEGARAAPSAQALLTLVAGAAGVRIQHCSLQL